MARRRTYKDDYWRLLAKGYDPFADAPSRPRATDYRESDFNDPFLRALRDDAEVRAARAERDAAVRAGRRDKGYVPGSDPELVSPEARRARASVLERDVDYGRAERKVDRAPASVQPYLSVYRDTGTFSPVVRVRGAGKAWRAGVDTPMDVIAGRVRDHKVEQLARAERAASERRTAPARQRAAFEAAVLQAQVKSLNRSIGQMRRQR